MAALLGVFAKYWQPGSVKTRLAAAVGADVAAGLYQRMLLTLLDRLRRLSVDRAVAYWPPDRHQAFAEALAGDNWQLHAQASGGLGERMTRFFQSAFSAGYRNVIIIGSDAPTIPLAFIDQAFHELRDKPIVLGPSQDGGYYLVGAAESVPPIFNGIEWSTPRVWDQTMERVQAAELPCHVLPTWYDIDEIETLDRLHSELNDLDDQAFDHLRREVGEVRSRLYG